jgi:hypothetical protein
MSTKFPERVYTLEELLKARELIRKGYKHELEVEGSDEFKLKVNTALKMLQTACYLDYLKTYIKSIVEIKGVSQLRETDATIWANIYTVKNSIEAAAYIIEKVKRMKNYIEGEPYSEVEEIEAVEKSVEFLRALRNNSQEDLVKDRCDEIIELLVGDEVL